MVKKAIIGHVGIVKKAMLKKAYIHGQEGHVLHQGGHNTSHDGIVKKAMPMVKNYYRSCWSGTVHFSMAKKAIQYRTC